MAIRAEIAGLLLYLIYLDVFNNGFNRRKENLFL